MADSSSSQDIFDVQQIRRLVELMEEHDLGEIDLRQGDTRVQIRRGSQQPVIDCATPRAAAPAPTAQPAPEASAEPAADEAHVSIIKSPMVGTFYASPDPKSAPYVKAGDHVGPETTVCIIEAMKVFNQIRAELSGKVLAVMVETGDPIEFGQPLFKVDTRG